MKQNPLIDQLKDDPDAVRSDIADLVRIEVDDPNVANEVAETIVGELVTEFVTKKNLSTQIVQQLSQELGPRKFRLLLAAACRHALIGKFKERFWDDLRLRYALDVLEEFADTGKGKSALREVWKTSKQSWNTRDYDGLAVLTLALSPTSPEEALIPSVAAIRDAFELPEHEAWNQLQYFHRDLVSPLADPTDFATEWRTPKIVDLARSMYESRDFSAMPRLADALEQAGCQHQAVLDHCRETGATHIRGCWVLDAILGDWIAKRPSMPKQTDKATGGGLRGLSQGDMKAIEDFMKREHNGAQLTVEELCERKFRRDLTESIKQISRPRPSWFAEQIRGLALWGQDTRDGLFPPDTVKRGIARRVAFNSPQEFARFLAIGARYEWINKGDGSRDPDRLDIPMLQAIAAHDFFVAQRFVDSVAATFNKATARKYGLLYFAIVALLTKNSELLAQVGKEMRRRKPSGYEAGLFESLLGAADSSSARVASGIERMLRGYPRGLMYDDILRFVDPQAHGIYELCFRYSPDLVSEVDVTRKKRLGCRISFMASHLRKSVARIRPQSHLA